MVAPLCPQGRASAPELAFACSLLLWSSSHWPGQNPACPFKTLLRSDAWDFLQFGEPLRPGVSHTSGGSSTAHITLCIYFTSAFPGGSFQCRSCSGWMTSPDQVGGHLTPSPASSDLGQAQGCLVEMSFLETISPPPLQRKPRDTPKGLPVFLPGLQTQMRTRPNRSVYLASWR